MRRFFRKRTLWLPTWRVWLPALLAGGWLAVPTVKGLHGFLAVTEPLEGAEVLVVEGWMPDGALQQVAERLAANPRYRYVCTTGIVIERGFYLSEIKDYATLAARTLEKLGVDPARMVVSPTPPVQRNRTYESAVALRKHLIERGLLTKEGRGLGGLDVVSVGTHARRTRMNFRHAFGREVPVGVIAIDWVAYDPERWWASSDGVKQVIMESISLTLEGLAGPGRGE